MADDGDDAVAEVRSLRISRGEKPDSAGLDEIGCLEVYDEDGYAIKFGDVFKHRKTLVVFVRHFLCFMCKEYVEDLAIIPDEYLKEAGVQLVVIGCAPYKFIKDFRRATGYKGKLYCDSSRELYKKMGCTSKEKIMAVKDSKHVKSNVFMGVLKSTWRSMQNREWQGNIEQQGGAFIIGPGNVMHFSHIDLAATDHIPINQLLSRGGVHEVNFPGDNRIFTV